MEVTWKKCVGKFIKFWTQRVTRVLIYNDIYLCSNIYKRNKKRTRQKMNILQVYRKVVQLFDFCSPLSSAVVKMCVSYRVR